MVPSASLISRESRFDSEWGYSRAFVCDVPLVKSTTTLNYVYLVDSPICPHGCVDCYYGGYQRQDYCYCQGSYDELNGVIVGLENMDLIDQLFLSVESFYQSTFNVDNTISVLCH